MNLPIKFGTNPSTIFLVIMVTDRHTHRHTNQRRWKHIPAFAGITSTCPSSENTSMLVASGMNCHYDFYYATLWHNCSLKSGLTGIKIQQLNVNQVVKEFWQKAIFGSMSQPHTVSWLALPFLHITSVWPKHCHIKHTATCDICCNRLNLCYAA